MLELYSISFLYDFFKRFITHTKIYKDTNFKQELKIPKIRSTCSWYIVSCRLNASSVTVDICASKNMKWSGYHLT